MQRTGVSTRFWLLITVVAMVALLAAQSGGFRASAQGPPDHVPDHVQDLLERTGAGEMVRVIVELRSQADQNPVAEQARGQGAAVHRQYNNFPLLALAVNENALRGLVRSPRVVSIEEDTADVPALDGSLPVIGADQVQTLGWDGDGITVAILDTGIDRDHPFLAGRVVAEACFSTNPILGFGDRTSLCPDGSTEQTGPGSASINVDACDDGGNNICDHGQHVAGIAAGDGDGIPGAPTAGVAPGANIIAIQVFTRRDSDGNCGGDPGDAPCVTSFRSDQIAGLDYVFDLRNDYTIAAANMSLGSGANASNCDGDSRKFAIDELRAENIATIISAGNDGLGEEVGAPGCISTAITIGSTTNADNVSGFSNRGPLLDLFAPGSGINASVDNDGFGGKSGTSMAAPHVTGAWAIMRQAYPGLDVTEVLAVLRDTGVDITYDSGPGNDPADWTESVTTPRIGLLAAIQDGSQAPDVAVDEAEVTVDEGDLAENTGTFEDHGEGPLIFSASVGNATANGSGTWSWTFQTIDGPTETQTVTISVANNKGLETEVEFDLVVDNVAPTVTIDPDQVTVIEEGDSLEIAAQFTDPGIEDAPFTATITCYDVNGFFEEVPGGFVPMDSEDPALHEGMVSGVCDYGDTSQSGDPPAGTFTVTVTVTDKDGDSGSDSFELTVLNVDPTVSIDTTNALVVNGVPTFVAQVGDLLDFSARVTDPGSDDLFLEWDWDDGNVDTETYLVDPPNADPFPSPNVNPRAITDEQSHLFSGACLFDVVLTAHDDDGGVGNDRVDVVIGGDAEEARSAGYWLTQYHGQGQREFESEALECLLAIVGHMSTVFHDEREAATRPAAAQVLHLAGNRGDMEEIFDRQLLAAWLNFANGAFVLDGMVDTTGDGLGDATFGDVTAAAEAVRLDPAATDAQLEEQKDILENINLTHGG